MRNPLRWKIPECLFALAAAFVPLSQAQPLLAVVGDDGRAFKAEFSGGMFVNWGFLHAFGYPTNRGIVMDQFDGDGRIDIVSGQVRGGDIAFVKLPGLPDGSFGAEQPLGSFTGSGGYLMDMASGDFNEDGIADFVAGGNSSVTGVFLSDGHGGFTSTTRQIEGGGYSRGMDVGDFNQDGHLDFAQARCCDGVFHVYLGDGTGHFAYAGVGGSWGSDPYGLAVADFDGDGNLDVITNDGGGGHPRFFPGRGDGTFAPGRAISGGETGNNAALDAYDYDGDGKADLVAVNYSSYQTLFFKGQGDGNFAPAVPVYSTGVSSVLLGVAAMPYVNPRAPIASVSPAEQTVAQGASAHFDASASSAPAGTIVSRAWNFGDGTTGQGAVVDHVYAAKGEYTVTHRVTADNRLSGLAVARVDVTGPAPQAKAGGPYVFGEGLALNGVWTGVLDGGATLGDGGNNARYLWNFMPDLSFSEDFSGGLPAGRWQGNGTVADGTLRIGQASLGSWGASYEVGAQNYPRRSGMTLYLSAISHASENLMFGFANLSDNHSYEQLPYAFYITGNGIYVYEAGTSRGYFRSIDFGTWYDFKLELTATGAEYWMRAKGATAWDHLYTSAYLSTGNLRIGFSGYYKGNNEIDDIYLGNREIGRQVTHSFTGPAAFPVVLTVTDYLGQSGSDTTTVTTTAGAAPVAKTGGPYLFGESHAQAGQWNAQFDGSGSTDDFGIAEYRWDFGDGATGTGPRPTHTYSGTGPYVLKLTVKDNAGQTNTDQSVVGFTAGARPVAVVSGPTLLDEHQAAAGVWTGSFSGAGSTDDVGIWRYEWSFGDGGTASGSGVTHGYRAMGAYTVALTVYDNAGQSHTASQQVQVRGNALPIADFSAPARIDESAARDQVWTAAFDAGPSTDDFGIWKYEWDFGDGSTGTGRQTSHGYRAAGSYAPKLTVYDNAGQSHSITKSLVVAVNDPPVARIDAAPLTVEGAQDVVFRGTGSTDDFGISAYLWNFGDRINRFAGTLLDRRTWTYGANVTQNERLIAVGANSWGSVYGYLNQTYAPGTEMRVRVRTPTGTNLGMFGFKNTGTDGSYAAFPAAFYFADGTIQVYENGGYRGSFGAYTRGNEYEVRVVTRADGADYSYRNAGAPDWTVIYHGATPPGTVRPGFTVNAGSFEIDDMVVKGMASGPQVTYAFDTTTTVQLTVTDHGGQTASATQTITVIRGNPPLAAIQAPASYGVGLEVTATSSGSSDDYGIAVYQWDFGDGSPAVQGDRGSHVYSAAGSYVIRLTVYDYAGQIATATKPIIITSQGVVRAIPWRFNNGIEIPHETWSGKEITLKAVANTAARPFTYNWDFGDGSAPATGTIATEADAYRLEAKHAYAGGSGTPYIATISIVDANGASASDTYPLIIKARNLTTEANIAIDEALWYLHKGQNRSLSENVQTGRWISYGNTTSNVTASAVQAFEINGHQPQGEPGDDPYVETVRRGLEYLFTDVSSYAIGMQPHGNPDANGNGIGLSVNDGDDPYQLGAVMDAILASGTPNRISRLGGANVRGRRYFDLVQDMADMFAWGQDDAGWSQGGWRYSWHGGADNSAAQWGAIGLLPAEKVWGVTVPAFVKEQNKVWTDYSYYPDAANCGFGYTGQGQSNELNASGLVQLAFQGPLANASSAACVESHYDRDWTNFMAANTTYGMYAFTKAMRLAYPAPIVNLPVTGRDWYGDDAVGIRRTLVSRQRADGSWLSSHQLPSEPIMNTAWSTIILTPTLFENPPVAVMTATPNPGAIGQAIRFDGSASYHLDPFRKVVSYAWDFDASDGVDWAHPDATGPLVQHAFGALQSYTVSLRVGDDQSPPHYDVATLRIDITVPPHPPTSVPGGPYVAAAGEAISLDGSGSYDIDQPQGDRITAYGWETDFRNPRDFQDALGAKPAGVRFAVPGTYNIGLRVTDNTAIAFPQAGQPNLTNDAYTTVEVQAHCLDNLAARTKETMVALTWTHDGSPSYTVQRSLTSPSYGFTTIGTTTSTYSTFIDYNVEIGKTYYYRVMSANACGSYAVSIVPSFRTANHRPVISSQPLTVATEGAAYRYRILASDPDGTPVSYFLDQAPAGMTIDADGQINWVPAFADVGVRSIAIRVSDGVMSAVQAYQLRVNPMNNLPPVARIQGPADGTTGQPLFFDGSSTTDPENNTPFAYAWNFGDGATATGATATHTFTGAGTYVVTLFVTDARGATGNANSTVVIGAANRPPIAAAGGPYLAAALDTVTLDGSASNDPDGDSLAFIWNFGDDSPPQSAAIARHAYAQPGTYLASLEVRDNRGGTATATVQVVVGAANHPPEARIASPAGLFANPGQSLRFDGTGSIDADGQTLLYSWSFGDGTGTTGDVVTHAWQAPGHYQVTLTADDQHGKTDTAQVSVHINAPPVFPAVEIQEVAQDHAYLHEFTATDADGDALTYALAEGPSGLSFDAGTGRIVWTPGNSDVGDHTVRITAQDGRGGNAQVTFTLRVDNVNDAPTFASSPVLSGAEAAAYQYAVAVNDIDVGDHVTVGLAQGPDGLSLDPATNILSWTPGHGDIGPHPVRLVATDLSGATAEQAFTLTIAEKEWAPEFTSTPPATATEKQGFTYQATASDLNAADALTFSLLSGPAGMTMTPAGLLTWNPGNRDVGPHTVAVRVSDGALNTDQSFTITVANVNDAPVITSTPPAIAVVGEAFSYTVAVSDSDAGDTRAFSLVQGSGNAAIGTANGILTWTPAESEVGPRTLRVRVTDGAGAFADQDVNVRVQQTPVAPVFSSTPVTTGTQGQPYEYQATATDGNDDPLTFALVSGPAGMTVSPAGLVRFTPGPAQTGAQAAKISVTDGRFSVEQAFVISVANVNDNPVIISAPSLSATAGANYAYQIVATDADGDSLAYSLTTAPAGMSVSPRGLVSWPSDAGRPAHAEVQVRVDDGQGGFATQAWAIDVVADNLPPRVTLRLSANPVAPGHFVTIAVEAVDNVGVASRTLSIGGRAVSLSAAGEYQYQAGAAGDVALLASATDSNGNVGTASFTLHVSASADVQGPQVSMSVSPAAPKAGDRISFDITASDPDGVDPDRIWLLVDGRYLPVVNGHAEYVAPMRGNFTALATAYDLAGNYGEAAVAFSVGIDGTDLTSPTVSLDAPAADSEIVGAATVAGTATDANFAYYTLSYLHHEGDAPVEFFRSSTPVSAGTLGSFDGSALENGIYRIRLTAFDRYGNHASAEIPVRVSGYMKLGAFSLSFVDMKVKLPGLSLLAKRDYDSRDKGKGDFGYGWRFSLSSAEVDENRRAGDGWTFRDVGSFLPYFVLDPTKDHDVTIVLPGGRKQEFEAEAQFDNPNFDTQFGSVAFHPLAGTYSKLEILDGADFIRSGDQLLDYDFNDFDPNLYKLTLPDGTYYILDQTAGQVTQVGDAKGNVIDLAPSGIRHSNGESLRFERDAENRIVAIQDGDGRRCSYAYDGHGNLKTATDPEGNTTLFKYGPNHYLTEAIDPRGVSGIRTEYDEEGRVVRQISPKGAVMELQHDLGGRRELTQDFNGGITAYTYDAKGNLVHLEDPAGNAWSYTYDANNNRTSTTNPDGGTFSTAFDAQGNKVRETDPLGNTVIRTFNAQNKPLTETDPAGRITRYTYDAAGNQLSVTGPDGRVLSRKTYDGSGNVLTETDAAGKTTTSVYDANGNLARRTDPLGNAVSYVNDKRGNVLRQTDARGGVTLFAYDGNDKLLSKTDPLGNVTRYAYNAIKKVSEETDPLGNKTVYTYDNYGELSRLQHPDGTFRTLEYDNKGNRIAETDERGQVTTMEYDERDHMIRKTFPDGGVETHEFDPAGNEIRVADPRGNATTYAYDEANRMVSSRNALGEETRYEYDAAGNVVAQIDGAGNRTAFEFDPLNRLVRVTGPGGAAVNFTFNDQGLHSSYADENGNLTRFAYDDKGNLTTVTDALGGVTTYAYDAAGNRISRTDALGRVTAFAYDPDNREISRTLPSGAVERTLYDSAGNVVRRIRPDGTSIDMAYDGMHRLISKILPGGSERTFTYLENGLRASMTDATGTVDYSYDAVGRVTQVSGPGAGTLSYAYDAAGNRTSLVSAAGRIRYAYDALGRLVEVIDPDGGQTEYAYDAAGNRIGTRLPSGNLLQYTYDSSNRLVGLTQRAPGGAVIRGFDYTLDAGGRRTSIRESSGAVRSYAYDALNRLTAETLDDTGSAPDAGAAYAYDAVGNRISKTVGARVIAYQYDSDDHLISGDGVSWTYDANGNIATRTEAGTRAEFAFDAENRMQSWRSGSSERRFLYDPDGVRIGETVDGAARSFIVDRTSRLSRILGETDADGNLTAEYVQGLEPVSIKTGGVRRYYLHDGLGSTSSLVSSNGTQTDAYDYDAFGALTASSGSTPNPYLFNGQRYDAGMGLYDLRARFMDPGTGRFLSRDPATGNAEAPMTFHPYLYAGDDPVNHVDPAGEFSTWFYGIRVHQLIGEHFVDQDPATHWSDRRLNTIVGGGPGMGVSIIFGLCRPDLIDLGFQWLYEIKPTGSWLDGRAQLLFYTYILNAAMPGANWSAGGTYLPPPILDLGGFAYALVSPPLSGVIIYDVVDFKVLFALAAAYTISSLEMDFSFAGMTAAMGFAF